MTRAIYADVTTTVRPTVSVRSSVLETSFQRPTITVATMTHRTRTSPSRSITHCTPPVCPSVCLSRVRYTHVT